jgi:hypothetical protein
MSLDIADSWRCARAAETSKKASSSESVCEIRPGKIPKLMTSGDFQHFQLAKSLRVLENQLRRVGESFNHF